MPESLKNRWPLLAKSLKSGGSDRTRTGDHLDHNQELYQLSYAHHGAFYFTLFMLTWRARQDSNLQPSA